MLFPLHSPPTAESTDDGPVSDRSVARSAVEFKGLSHVIDAITVDVAAVRYDDEFSSILSLELLVNDARFANSSLKLLDDKLRLDIVVDDVVDDVPAVVNCVLMS